MPLQRAPSGNSSLAPNPSDVPPIVHEVLRSPGKPLDGGIRDFAESRFGHDFGLVRIHNDERSAKATASLRAAAFTLGNDIVFGANRYAPRSVKGRLLLYHELRHVEQQRWATPVASPGLDSRHSAEEVDAGRFLDNRVEPLTQQRIQCAPEEAEFSLGSGVVDSVGKSAFGETSWPFLKAVFEGFVGGLMSDVKGGRADAAKSHLASLFVPWNAAKFYAGYLLGLVIGLVSPITDLIKGIIGIVKLAIGALEWLIKWSPAGIAVSPERQQKISRLMQTFADLSLELGKALIDFAADPKGTIKKIGGFLDNLMQMALGKARELGAKAAHSMFDYLEKDYFDMGQGIGEVIGALVAQVLLLVFTDAIGNLISKGASFLGKAAEFVAGKAVEVFAWVKDFVSKGVFLLRNAVKGALKLFEGLVNKAIEAFDALGALFFESEALSGAGETVAAGVGRGVTGPNIPTAMEARMVSSTRTAPAKVADLTPPKVHPSNLPKEVTAQPKSSPATSLGIPIQEDIEAGHMQPVGKTAAGMAEKPQHHIFPRELEKKGFWRERGFKPNEVDEYCVELPEYEHQAQHGGGDPWLGRREWKGEWNSEITARILEREQELGRKLTKREVLALGKKLQRERGIDLTYVKWRGSSSAE
jgi:hypothetical protein